MTRRRFNRTIDRIQRLPPRDQARLLDMLNLLVEGFERRYWGRLRRLVRYYLSRRE